MDPGLTLGQSMSEEYFQALIEMIYEQGGSPEWIVWPCGCEYNGVQDIFVRECEGGRTCGRTRRNAGS